MKMKLHKYIVMVSICALIVAGSFSSVASSLDHTETSEEITEQVTSEEVSTEQATVEQTATEQVTSEQGKVPEITTEDATEELTPTDEENDSTTETNTEQGETSETMEPSLLDEEATVDINELVEMSEKDSDIQNGQYYYLQKYLYDCKIVYINTYIDYLQLQVDVAEKMYELGEITEATVKTYKSAKALAEAELKISENESSYYNVYLQKNELDYSDYDVKDKKSVESIDYYIENYPELDYMSLARYVTDYNNAVAQIQAKEVEIDSLQTDVAIGKVLLDAGEISKLEYKEKEVSLAKAQFELEQQYVAMHVSYWQLMMLCE